MKNRAYLATLTLVLGSLLAGCEDTPASALAGSIWRLDGWSASSLQPSDFTITATFDDEGIRGSSAVNIYRGTYSDSGGYFSVRDISSTEIAGPEPAMRAERIYLALLKDARRYERTATTLVLKSEFGNDLLYFVATK